jgi:hypothetical protein
LYFAPLCKLGILLIVRMLLVCCFSLIMFMEWWRWQQPAWVECFGKSLSMCTSSILFVFNFYNYRGQSVWWDTYSHSSCGSLEISSELFWVGVAKWGWDQTENAGQACHILLPNTVLGGKVVTGITSMLSLVRNWNQLCYLWTTHVTWELRFC